MDLEKYLEYEMIIWLINEDDKGVKDSWGDLDEERAKPTDGREERVVKYCFDSTQIVAYRQTYIRYNNLWYEAVVCDLGTEHIETPPLLVKYDQFVKDLRMINENLDGDNQKETEFKERGV